jgi:hypothetical protein
MLQALPREKIFQHRGRMMDAGRKGIYLEQPGRKSQPSLWRSAFGIGACHFSGSKAARRNLQNERTQAG